MNISDSISLMMREAHMSNLSVAKACGLSSGNTVAVVRKNNAARVSKFCQIAQVCGYRLYVQSLKTGELTRISGTKPAPDNEKTAMEMTVSMRETAGLSFSALGAALGYKEQIKDSSLTTPGGLGHLQYHDDMNLNRFLRIAEVCEFKVLLRPVVLNSKLPIHLHYEPSRTNLMKQEEDN